ncbi:glycosyltransferase family 4 protein [Actinacidiphila bryophytorum]|uniref:GDP-mannose-dependent alpha-mannosyltransferase n=1 Tax=Actinacidiphila bryophytorum TaxID=1436133 RepID=A0A9W4E3B2_9ACTN|nr:glycosyltransferase family 1 protein [Actinacidiphila bryophytorum]MBM9439251.1 glycosyltransferase family 1 protein [Actinacidiphila bryophytorum]MBN6546753.1 glycosyltransferase family 1 protein [Actinacidiphila bryophytorum]CAG7619949.1 GDP-mannose-dependent alpha-mannosyltransferase [Actinacidiphila bryophytorum]
MRVAIVTESFPPDVNGVAHCALRTAEHLARRGHEPMVVAPAGPHDQEADDPCPVVRVPSLPLPGYPQVRVAIPGRRTAAAIAAHRADIVHLASPFVLGVRGLAAATRLRIPAVAVYQTDLAGYAKTYLNAGEAAAWRRIRAVHSAAARTLAPSTASAAALEGQGVPRVHLWPRGVDSVRFHPARRDEALRRELAPRGELIVGYVGRLAAEKQVELLAGTCELPGVRVVVVGDGPSMPALRQALPRAVFLGRRTGGDLARIYASLDVFCHTGPFETFCQTVQEAMASGIPVVAPAAGGPLDLVDHGRTGLLVPPGDDLAVKTAVRMLHADPRLRVRFGSAARAAVAERSWEAVGDQLLGHYAQVLGERAVAAA